MNQRNIPDLIKNNKTMATKKNVPTKLSVYSVPNVTATRMLEKNMNDGVISYGSDNRYPDYLWNLYCDAPTQQAAIDFKQSCILGRSLGSHSKDVINTKGQTITDVAKKAVFDYVLFGGMAFQVIYNALGEIAEVYCAQTTMVQKCGGVMIGKTVQPIRLNIRCSILMPKTKQPKSFISKIPQPVPFIPFHHINPHWMQF